MNQLPIDVVPGSNPPIFRWKQTVDALGGKQTVEHVSALPATVEAAVVLLIKEVKRLDKINAELHVEVNKLQAFKDWVHDYLDGHGVPHHPEGTHGAAGCRIGDRMDWLMAKIERLTSDNQVMRGSLNMTVDRLGGIVEGKPTHEGNFLQRIDELVATEAEVLVAQPKQLAASVKGTKGKG